VRPKGRAPQARGELAAMNAQQAIGAALGFLRELAKFAAAILLCTVLISICLCTVVQGAQSAKQIKGTHEKNH